MIRPGARGGAAFGFSFDKDRPEKNKKAREEDVSKGVDLADRPPEPGAALPVAAYRCQILFLVERHATLILLGETGSGKTTHPGAKVPTGG